MRHHKLTILVSGMMAGVPQQGGATWAVLQYVLGLRQLGHQVLFVEPVSATALHPAGCGLDGSKSAAYFRDVVAEFDLDDSAALLLEGTHHTIGVPYDQVLRTARHAQVLLNIAGTLREEALVERTPTRIYLDIDPGFTQLWQAGQGIDMRFGGHTHFVTIGQTIGEPGSPIPTCNRRWIPTLQPLCIEHWPVAERIELDAFTTIGNWRGYGSIQRGDLFFGQKAHSLRRFMALPTLTSERFVMALSIHTGEATDLAALADNRWELLDPAEVADTPGNYQRFIQSSKAEFSVAKSGYAVWPSGWFSDRSICYLASGRPVIAQETGFSRFLPTGQGLFAFDSNEQAIAAVEAIRSDYAEHARAARQIAQDFFDSRKVLPRLLESVGVGA